VPATIHDATVIPWPFADRSFDLFLALQVFEHLKDRQPEAFLEVRRIARHAILSLPIDWVMEDPRNKHHMIPHERVMSWFAPVTPTRILEHTTGTRKRLIYVFEDLPAP
jgi:Methyltransferase domain